ncbi:MAG TPA: hypothetical protein VLR26_06735 [Frankiaceae bacterium]|nr:hypothetical protein [Frankiaceae bacterium]
MASFAVSTGRSSTVRSPGGVLTAWLGAWLQNRTTADDLLAVVGNSDLPPAVDGLPDEPDGAPLVRLLAAVRACGPSTVELRLPVAGDADGLGPDVLPTALEAGEAVVVTPADVTRPGLVLVPRPDVRGSEIEPVIGVRWLAVVPARRVADGPAAPTRLREAEILLDGALTEAIAVLLASGQVDQLSPEALEAIQELRRRRATDLRLPTGSPPDAVRVLVTAERLGAVVRLAAGGRPLSSAGDARRAEALREVATAIRWTRRLAYTACAAG